MTIKHLLDKEETRIGVHLTLTEKGIFSYVDVMDNLEVDEIALVILKLERIKQEILDSFAEDSEEGLGE